MSRTRVKICGITREADAQYAVELGADALGFVFYSPSSRNLDPGQARLLTSAVGPLVTRVGVFFDPDESEVYAVLEKVALDLLQFHGNESPEFCAGFGKPYIKGARVSEGFDFDAISGRYPQARGWLLDSLVCGRAGGTGEPFDWDLIPVSARHEIILAGGLNADNLGRAIAEIRPWAVDVSSAVESSGGIKCPVKMKLLFEAIQAADRQAADRD